MKKFLIGAMIVAATAATPAMAQRNYYASGAYGNTVTQLDRQIEHGRNSGYLDNREYAQLRQNQSVLHARIAEYARGGINNWERNEIETRIARQRYNIDMMIREDSRRGYNRGDRRPGRRW